MINLNFKQQIHAAALDAITQKLTLYKEELNSVIDAGSDETKSSAGDKHEVGNAMMQLEQEKLSNQIADLQNTRAMLVKIDLKKNTTKGSFGALVQLENGVFYIAVSLGAIKIEDKQVFVISQASPIGEQLKGKSVGETITFNGKSSTILAIC